MLNIGKKIINSFFYFHEIYSSIWGEFLGKKAIIVIIVFGSILGTYYYLSNERQYVIDTKKEHIAVAEAREKKIPVIALTGSDCDISIINYPIPANDSSVASIELFARKIAEAYTEGKKAVVAPSPAPVSAPTYATSTGASAHRQSAR